MSADKTIYISPVEYADLLTAAEQRGARRALREAADAWDEAGTCKPSILGGWLRDRADRVGGA